MKPHEYDLDLARRLKIRFVEILLDAYEDAGIRGLCDEGRFEVAVDAVRSAELTPVVESVSAETRNDA